MSQHQHREKQKQMVRRMLKPHEEVTDFVKKEMILTCLTIDMFMGKTVKIYCACMFTWSAYKSTHNHQSVINYNSSTE